LCKGDFLFIIINILIYKKIFIFVFALKG